MLQDLFWNIPIVKMNDAERSLIGLLIPTTRFRGEAALIASGSITWVEGSAIPRVTLDVWVECLRIPNFSTGWRVNCATVADR